MRNKQVQIILNDGPGRFFPYNPTTADLHVVYTIKNPQGDYLDEDVLDMLYEEFNIRHPEDYLHRSLSVGDVVALDDRFYAVESFGFRKIETPKFRLT